MHRYSNRLDQAKGRLTSYKILKELGFNSKHLLLWKLIEYYSNLGIKKFHLGGVSNIHAENNPYFGLNKFKMSFHSMVYEYMGDLELITNSSLYFMYQNTIPLKNIMKK